METTTTPAAGLALGGITVLSVPVADQERALAFYTDVLGFSVVYDAPFEGGLRWIQLVPPGGGATIALVDWFDAMPPGSLQGTVLGSADVDADYAALSERGVEFSAPPADAFWGRHTEFADPDGNGWILMQDADPAGA